MDKESIKKLIQETLKKELKSGLFTSRKVTDYPTDALAVVNRKFVTQNGTTATRPMSSILGLQYFDTTIGYPVYWNGSTWVDGSGTPS